MILDNDGKTERRAIHVTGVRSELWWIEHARQDPFYFIWYITGDKPAIHHRLWLAKFLHPTQHRINLIAPRESAKTTIALYTLAWCMATNPLLTFGIIAVSDEVAKLRLALLRDLFGDNQRFRNVFPWIHIDYRHPDTQNRFTIYSDYNGMNYAGWRTQISAGRSQLDKNPSVFAIGNGGKGIIGRRISGILLLDDMVDETFLSVEAQEKMIRYIYQTLEPCLTREGRIWNIGTRWMVDDMYERLSKNKSWITLTIPAIIYDDENQPHSYWPGHWPLWALEAKRAAMDDDIFFRTMYLCDPQAVTAQNFRVEDLHRDLPDVLPEFVQIYVTTDLAISQQSYADWNVIYIVGVDRDRNVYILDGDRYKEEAQESVERMIELADSSLILYERLNDILIEHVGFQVTFSSLINSRRPDLPVRGVHPKGDKMQRSKAVSMWARKGRLFINQNLPFISQLHAEWLNFPMHKYDDTLDPISLLFQHLDLGTITAQLLLIKPTAMKLSLLRRPGPHRPDFA